MSNRDLKERTERDIILDRHWDEDIFSKQTQDGGAALEISEQELINDSIGLSPAHKLCLELVRQMKSTKEYKAFLKEFRKQHGQQ